MLNKKVTSLCLLALMGGNFIVGSGAAFADAKEETKDAKVTYDNRNLINDPDHTNDPFYVIATPGNVTFTDDNKTFDGSVQMLKPDASGFYEGDGVADVSVQSANQYDLKLDGADPVAYDFLYASTKGATAATDKKMEKTAGFQKLATMNKTDNEFHVRYKMTGKATKQGAHTDTLTFKVTSNTVATN
ncbi:hypothetical protein [Enterococcus hirae]|uniref:hypothetical protein n=1 Tax=Enterococcus hirae TaxID=1354 RepID=UPI001377B501|nr:hypothetical protein [Enterococcus hirae]NBA56633.1 hypothetical protein [Enterococcus hirae]